MTCGRPLTGLTGLRLTPCERHVLQLLWDGCSTKEMATQLEMTESAVGEYRKSLLKKFGARNSVHLVRLALNHQLVEL